MRNFHLTHHHLTEIYLPPSVYSAIVPVAFAKNTTIRDITERLFRGSLRRSLEVPSVKRFQPIKQGILITQAEIRLFKRRLDLMKKSDFKYAFGVMITHDLVNNHTPDKENLSWTILELAYRWPL